MAQEPTETNTDENCLTRRDTCDEEREKVTEMVQPATQQGQMEDPQCHVSGDCGCDGSTVERIRIVFASDLPLCECCGEPYCEACDEHYADCSCVGPHNAEDEGYRLVDENGILYGIKPSTQTHPSNVQPHPQLL